MAKEYNSTKCKFCGTKKVPLFIMPMAEDKDSYWCIECRKKKEGGN